MAFRFLTRLRVDFRDLRDHRFNHHFNCINPICACGLEIESTEHFLLRCHRFALPRTVLMGSISDVINPGVLQLPDDHLTQILLFGSKVYNGVTNILIH